MTDNAVYINDIAAFLPNKAVANADMERILGQVGNRPSRARRTVLRSNGIKQRYYAIDPETLQHNYTNASMTAQAVRALAGTNLALADIDCLCCGTSIPDQIIPNHASMVQGELQIKCCEAVATSGVCASSIAALKYAYMSVLCGQHKNVVATGSDLSSARMTAMNFQEEVTVDAGLLNRQPELAFEKDFLRWMLSDGAGAMLLQDTPRAGATSLRIDWLELMSYAGEIEPCMYAGAKKSADGVLTGWQLYTPGELADESIMAVKQDVKLLNENIVHYTVEKPLQELKDKHQLNADNIDWFIPHYSSNFFRDKLLSGLQIAGLDIPQEKWFTNLSTKGNTGAASIYIMLEELIHSGNLSPGQSLLCYIPESGRFSTAFMHLTVV